MVNCEKTTSQHVSAQARRHAIRLAYVNGGLWGMGNGLAGTTLIFYLVQAYDATGLQLSWLLAAPALVGVLRLFTPLWMDHVGDRRRFCTRLFLASATILMGVPLLSLTESFTDSVPSVWMVVVCWTGYHLLEHFGVVALWSWFCDLVPTAIRGRFVGRRKAWMNGGKVTGGLLAAVGTFWWRHHCTINEQLDRLPIGYAMFTALGAMAMVGAVAPLARMHNPISPAGIGKRSANVRYHEMILPFTDRRFRRLLAYGCWLSLANGITATAIRVFQISVLQLTFAEKRTLDALSRGSQSLLMPWVGRVTDRRGNVVVLVVSQLLVAASMLFLLIASAEARWWIIGAYVLWIAYAGINVAMPSAMLRLTEPTYSTAYSAAWFASTQLCYALSALAGGALFDQLADNGQPIFLGSWKTGHFSILLLVGFLLRLLATVLAARVRA